MGIENNGHEFHTGGDADELKAKWEADKQKVEKEKARAKFLMDYAKVNKMNVGDNVSYKTESDGLNEWKIESIEKGDPQTLEGLKIVLVRKVTGGELIQEVGLDKLDDIKDFFSTKE